MNKKTIFSLVLFSVLLCTLSFATRAYATDGAVDETFNSNGSGGQLTGFNGPTDAIEVQASGKILVTGNFTAYDGTTVGHIVRLNSDGTIDSSFNTGGAGANGEVIGVTTQSDGKILITGATAFTAYNGVSVPHLARLNSDGTLDTTFNTNIGTGPNTQTRGVAVGPLSGGNQGKILVGGAGAMTTFNSAADKNVVRLNSDGTPDTAFNANIGSTGFNATVYNFGFQSTDKIIAAGNSTTVLGHSMRGIVRLNSDGTFDTTFNTGLAGTNGTVYSLEVLPNDKILVGGSFTTYDGATTGKLIRLNSDGTLDTAFDSNYASGGAGSEVDYIYTQPNGKIMIGESSGGTGGYNGVSHGYVFRLNSDGSIDSTFSSGTGISGQTNDMSGLGHDYFTTNGTAFLPNGNTIMAGGFSGYNGTTVGSILSIQTDITNPVLSPVTIASNNPNPAYAKSGDVITLSFTSNHPLTASTITLGGQSVSPSCSASTGTSVNCTSPITVTSLIPASDGAVTFSLDATTVGGETVTTSVTDASSVTVLRTTPTTPTINSITSPTTNHAPVITGTCTTGDTVTITIGSQTLTSSCSGGTYSITPTTLVDGSYTIGATQADAASNASAQSTISLVIETTYNLTYTAGSNGTLTGTTSQTIVSGSNGTAVTAVPNGGYSFTIWSDGSITNPRTDTNVTSNISVTANFVANPIISFSSATGGSNPYVTLPPTTNPVTRVITPPASKIFGSGPCPASLLITQNLKQGNLSGKYDNHNKTTITQVTILQKQINRILAMSYNQAAGPVDGNFGALTQQGVDRLQKTLNSVLKPTPLLKIDGMVGPFTREVLNNSCGGM